ncbi:uncharacterized protein LOC128720499 [Anopheles nili]|uniref:uncharacterized protein LOC128720499 n=1 Tax=Anopheles nili TaxID=185578 RepID=UPI00237B84B0|nr:uncharacterized protein LOC128720499 [Anopheles nili]
MLHFKPTIYFLLCCCFQASVSSPVLLLVANGSDVTINFPGENNNNRLINIVSGSDNNNPFMYDWIGGNGANKAPTITLGNAHLEELPFDTNMEEKSEPWIPNKPKWQSHEIYETASMVSNTMAMTLTYATDTTTTDPAKVFSTTEDVLASGV